MENTGVKETIAKNLTELRKSKKMTQQELAKRLNYSDKAISRWEHAETLPDIETLCKICDLYGVKFEYLLQREQPKKNNPNVVKDDMPNRVVILLVAAVSIWLAAILSYICVSILFAVNAWTIFVWTVPVCAICCLVGNRFLFQSKIMSTICASFTVWTSLLALYIQLLINFGENLWLLFLLGIPMQSLVILLLVFRPKVRR